MERLRGLLRDAYDERGVLEKEIANATGEVNTTKVKFENWERGFLLKRLRKQTFAARKQAAETALAKMEELQEQLRQTTLATEITIDREQAEPYYRMRDDFATFSGNSGFVVGGERGDWGGWDNCGDARSRTVPPDSGDRSAVVRRSGGAEVERWRGPRVSGSRGDVELAVSGVRDGL
jgi:hypothetical protein